MAAKNTNIYDESDYIRFLGAKLRLAKKLNVGVSGSTFDDEALVYRHDKFIKQGFSIRLMIFGPMAKNTHYEAMIKTPMRTKVFSGEELMDVEFDAMYFLRHCMENNNLHDY